MSAHGSPSLTHDNLSFAEPGAKWFKILAAVGVVALGGAFAVGSGVGDNLRQFQFSYLLSFSYFMSIALGMLFFVTVQHLTRAGWSVTVRRIAENYSAAIVLLFVLLLPLLGLAMSGNHELWLWLDHDTVEKDHILHGKAAYLNLGFFLARLVFYFGFWTVLSLFFLKSSTTQDTTGDANLTRRMEIFSAPAMLLFALTLTFAAVDLIMSVEPHFFSTIWGVYFFAGSLVSGLAVMALTLMGLQKSGRMASSVTTEHYHDIGKLMFGFTFFWGYIAFSQFMLIWYANVPEETFFFQHRIHGGWLTMTWILLITNFIIPFLGILSRHVKRNRFGLAFWACWLLVTHYLDLYWLIMPSLREGSTDLPFHLTDVLTFVGIGALFLATTAFLASKRSLVPVKDPRLSEALSFENI